jgi:DNA-binding NarL/FixJ family response regulator
LLDLHIGGRHSVEGFDCLRKLRGLGYQGFVVMWSGDNSLAMAHRGARAGAKGYLL